MGDIRGLIDLAPEDMDEEEAMRITQRMMTGRFTLNDMYSQMEMMSKVGTIDKLLSFCRAECLVEWVLWARIRKKPCRRTLTDIV